MAILLHELIERSALKTPDATALHYKNQQLNYQALVQAINHLAACMQAIGLKRYERVGIYLPKSIEAVESIFACSVAGGTFVPINPVLKAPQVSHIVNDCDIQILITNKARLTPLSRVTLLNSLVLNMSSCWMVMMRKNATLAMRKSSAGSTLLTRIHKH